MDMKFIFMQYFFYRSTPNIVEPYLERTVMKLMTIDIFHTNNNSVAVLFALCYKIREKLLLYLNRLVLFS